MANGLRRMQRKHMEWHINGTIGLGTQDEAGSGLVLGTNTGRTLRTFTAACTYRLIKQRMKSVSRTPLLNDWSTRIHLKEFSVRCHE